MIPFRIRRRLRLEGADGGIPSVLVEVAAVVARMVEYAVQHDSDSPLSRLLHEAVQVLLRSEQAVDAHIIARVVAVIGVRLEDGIEIDDGHMQAGEHVELFGDAVEIAAEEVVVEHLSVLVGAIARLSAPIVPKNLVGLDGIAPRLIKAVGEDLIHHAALEPFGRAVRLVVDGDLPTVVLFGNDALAEPAAGEIAPVPETEIIEIQPDLIELQVDRPPVFRALHGERMLLFSVAEQDKITNVGGEVCFSAFVAIHIQSERTASRNGADDRFTRSVERAIGIAHAFLHPSTGHFSRGLICQILFA